MKPRELPDVDSETPLSEIKIPDPRPELSPEDVSRRRKIAIRKRIKGYGTLLAILYVGIWYQPYEFDIIPRKLPNPNPRIDPDSKTLFSKGTKILIVTAHPDDSEFFIGGLLPQLKKSGAEMHQVICTDGDKGYYWIFTNADENRRVRREEATNAAAASNIQPPILLGYPDRFLHVKSDVIAGVTREIESFRPDYILAFDGDYPPRASHQDHRRSGDVAKIAAERTHIAKWLMLFSTNAPNYFVDISNNWEDQKKLLAIHKSQFYGKKLEGVENMVGYNAEKDGERGGFDMGEGFRCIKLR